MIAKKNPKFNLEKNRMAFLQLGLFIGASLILTAFTWRSPNSTLVAERLMHESDIPIETLDKPEVIKEEKQVIVDNDKQQNDQKQASQDIVDLNQNDLKTKKNQDKQTQAKVNPTPLPGVKTGKDLLPDLGDAPKLNEVVKWPDKEAHFPGEDVERLKFLKNTIEYPAYDLQWGTQGKVWVTFVVEKDGSITGVETLNSVSRGIDREARRVVRSMPKWIAGEKDGEKVRTQVRFAINFRIQ